MKENPKNDFVNLNQRKSLLGMTSYNSGSGLIVRLGIVENDHFETDTGYSKI